MKTKKIIKRNLDLTKKYTFIDKKYIPLLDGFGLTCANCNKLIANIASVKSEKNEVFNIGLDCLETLMLNNKFLQGQKIDFENIKKSLPKVKKERLYFMEMIRNNPQINKITIEKSYSNWIDYLFYVDNKIVWNSNEKIKNFIPELFISTMNEINKNVKFELV
jgi:hypothetical protein